MKQRKQLNDKNDKTTSTAAARTEAKPPAAIPNFEADANKGLENTDKDSFAIPFLLLLQSNSPQIETVEGAKAGMFLNSVTNELMKEVLVIPCAFERKFLRWAPREDGGGFKGSFSADDVLTGKIEGITYDEDNRMTLDGDLLADTRLHYALVTPKDKTSWQPALISMKSTQIKKSRRWLSRIAGIEMTRADGSGTYNPPSFSHIYSIGSVKEENNEGTWWGFSIDLFGQVDSINLYAKAKVFHDNVVQGKVEVAPPSEDDAPAGNNKGAL